MRESQHEHVMVGFDAESPFRSTRGSILTIQLNLQHVLLSHAQMVHSEFAR